MSGSRRQDLSERAAAVTAARSTTGQSAGEATTPSSTTGNASRPSPPRSKPVRITMDLEPAVYRELQRYATSAADQLGRVRVPNIAVMRALLAELLADDELGQRIQNRLRETFDD